MKCSVQVEKTYTLELTEEEARWLRGLVQNPIPNQKNPEGRPELEDEYDMDMRRRFWDALNSKPIFEAT